MIIGLVPGEVRANIVRSWVDQIIYAFTGFEKFLPLVPTPLHLFVKFWMGEVDVLTKLEVAEETIGLFKRFLIVPDVVLDICVDVTIGEEPSAVAENVALVDGDASIALTEISDLWIWEDRCLVAKTFAAAETVAFTAYSLTASPWLVVVLFVDELGCCTQELPTEDATKIDQTQQIDNKIPIINLAKYKN